MSNERHLQYEQHLQSSQWQQIRDQKLSEVGHRCEFNICDGDDDWLLKIDESRCPATKELEVHHLSYASLGHEPSKDLKVLCVRHHALMHAMTATCWRCNQLLFENDVEVLRFFGESFDELTANDIIQNYTECDDIGNYCECDRRWDSA
jgi:hypothetical protein